MVVADDAGRQSGRRHAAHLAETGWVAVVVATPDDGVTAAAWVRDHRAVLGALDGEVHLIAL